jgi:Protein of Unknown function (DUF2784)
VAGRLGNVGYGWLVTTVLVLHFVYVAYVVLGGFFAWRWPKAIWPHLVACAWGILIVAGWVDCPLTWAEDWARQKAGQTPLTEGFVDRYLDNVIYPDRYVRVVQLAVALVVGGSWLGAYLRARARRRAAAADAADAEQSAAGAGRPASAS